MFPTALVDALHTALSDAAGAGELAAIDVPVEVERPRDPEHGDWASNLALAAAKPAGKSPREVAEILARRLPAVPHLDSVQVAGPGFLNFRLAHSWLEEVLRSATVGPDWARTGMGGGSQLLVEFVSSNPTGPLHIGHGRGAVLGDALCNLLGYAGFAVGREYYLNDAGTQIDLFVASLHSRYLQALGREADVPAEGYRGRYLQDWGRELAEEQGAELVGDLDAVRGWGLERALRDITETLELAGVHFGEDEFFRERWVVERGEVTRALEVMRDLGYVYESEGATWFKTTDFGDEKDRVLVKGDGSYTYITPDIAYHYDKYSRGYQTLVNIWGADHHGYVPRIKAAVAAFGRDADTLEIIITQLVKVLRGGEEVKMSTRAGEFVSFREVLDEVGRDATRYFLSAYSPDTAVSFDLDVARKRSMDNPVYYLQYAHARVASLERFAAAQGIDRGPLEAADLSLLTHAAEEELLRQIDRLPEEVEEAALRRAPHRVAAYGHELAGAFHKFYTDVRVIGESGGRPIPAETTRARLWLVEAAKNTLLAVLQILGISAPEEM